MDGSSRIFSQFLDVSKLTSSIYECNIVATALMILSTFGFEIVDPIYIEFIVEDFLISKSSSSSLMPAVRLSILFN